MTSYTYNKPTRTICRHDSDGKQTIIELTVDQAKAFETLTQCVTEAWCGSFITTNEYEGASQMLFAQFMLKG